MPGTIQVSVLDLMDIPSPASPSNVSVTVAIGKREYQTSDKGDFLFPLTTFREKLIVTLRDAKNNEMSRTEVEIMLVVQKGFWDDLFPLEGGGRVRMRLQFTLSDDERKRIQDMREYVVKKKQEELVKKSIINSNTPTATATSDLLESFVPVDAMNIAGETSKSPMLGSSSQNENAQCSGDAWDDHLVQTAAEASDPSLECSGTPLAKDITENSNSVSSTPGEDRTHSFETPASTKLSPSSVKKMISAFETNLNQEPKNRVSSLVKPQISKIEIESSSKRPWIEEVNREKEASWQLAKSRMISFSARRLPEGHLQLSPMYSKALCAEKLEETLHSNMAIGGETAGRGKEPGSLQGNQTFKNSNPRSQKGLSVSVDKILSAQYSSECDDGSNSTGVKYPVGFESEQLDVLEPKPKLVEETNSGKERVGSSCSSLLEGDGWKVSRKYSETPSISKSSNKKWGLAMGNAVAWCLFGSSCSWIYEDEMRHLCITTGSKQIRSLVEGYGIYAETQEHPRVVDDLCRTEDKSNMCRNVSTGTLQSLKIWTTLQRTCGD